MTEASQASGTLDLLLDLRSGGGAVRILAGLREAERRRLEGGCDGIRLTALAQGAAAPISAADRLDRVLLQAAPGLLPSVRSIALIADETACESATPVDTVGDGRGLPPLSASAQAAEHVSAWVKNCLNDRRFLLVGADAFPETEWAGRVSDALAPLGYAVVLLPPWGDAGGRNAGQADGWEVAPGAGYNAELRVALHRAAAVGVAAGPVAAAFCDAADDGRGHLAYRTLPEIAALCDDLEALRARRAASGIAEKPKDEVLTLDDAYLRARRLHQRGSGYVRGAVTLLQGILGKNPHHPNALAEFGHVLHFYRQHRDAMDFLQCAIALKDDDPAYFFNLALACHAAGEPLRARVALEGALELDPSLYEAWDMLGIVFRDLGDSGNALRCFAEAVDRGPGDQHTLAAYARLLAACGRWEEAHAVSARFAAKDVANRDRREAESTAIWPWRPRLYPPSEGRFPDWAAAANSAR
ncbi:MAG: hypothetical protein AB7G39_17470 [Alphaproteobacteria bacterium]